jgi:hypothetical protein
MAFVANEIIMFLAAPGISQTIPTPQKPKSASSSSRIKWPRGQSNQPDEPNFHLVYAALGTKNSDDGQLPDDLLHNV